MELQRFIAESLKQIVGAVAEAQEDVKVKGGSVNPALSQGEPTTWDRRTQTKIQDVEFDVAVTDTHESGTKGGIGVLTGMINVGSHGKTEKSNVSVTRLRFTIPIALPSRKIDDE